jgi:hypothetical protein
MVHGVVFPECALDPDELATVRQCLQRREVPMLLAGVRDERANFAVLDVVERQSRGTRAARYGDYRQHKHHRWCLDARQIYDYRLGAKLHPRRYSWEDIDVPPRKLHFLSLGGWLTMCHLICEDLARVDPVAQVVRSVGPNLVIALLLDGPQLEQRWPGRYASVLAEDPGSSVLTLTSLGMVARSTPRGKAPSRVVALWKDRINGAHELSLDAGAKGILLTLSGTPTDEWTADHRRDRGDAGLLTLSGVEQLAWASRAAAGNADGVGSAAG